MIIDSLKNSEQYEQLNPLFKKAFDYLKKLDFSALQAEKIELQGRDLHVSISNSKLKNKPDAKLEVHNKYIDIQMPVSKPETFGWSPRSIVKTKTADFNEEKDIQFFEDQAKTYFTLEPDNFVIFFPEDAHAPCIGEGDILKIVVKVKVQ
ncbi:MAG: YhcH/YjgK/YiaL family protein [Dysgonomonas sp.]